MRVRSILVLENCLFTRLDGQTGANGRAQGARHSQVFALCASLSLTGRAQFTVARLLFLFFFETHAALSLSPSTRRRLSMLD